MGLEYLSQKSNKLRRTFLTGLAAGVLIYGCGRDSPTEPPISQPVDTPPRATTQSISPTSGMSPLEVRARYTCTDDKGITEYRLTKGSRVFTKSNPIDTIVTFTETGTLGMSCKDAKGQTASYGPMSINVTRPPVNSPPQTTLTASPTSGVSPLNVRVQYTCTDPDGANDIAQSLLTVGSNTYSTTATNSIFTFTQSGKVSASCKDKAGEESTKGPIDITVTQPHVNNPPQTTLTVNPTFGVAPLEVRVQYACTDPDGANDIAQSYLEIGDDKGGSERITTTSLNELFTFNGSKIINGYCKDKAGEESKKGPFYVEVAQPEPLDQIAFWRQTGTQDIYLMTLNEDRTRYTDLERITTHPDVDFSPTWSPDGSQIAFSTSRNGSLSIYVINADGTNLRRLSPPGLQSADDPDWSPNGFWITFDYEDENSYGVGKILFDGRGFQKLFSEPKTNCDDFDPDWSPDGSQIAFSTCRDGNFEIYTMNSYGNAQRNITNNPATDIHPDWSPDGGEILFISSRNNGNYDPHLINTRTLNATSLIQSSWTEREAVWSPDGEKIAFVVWNLNDIPRIFSMNRDGSNWSQLIERGRHPAWRPRQ